MPSLDTALKAPAQIASPTGLRVRPDLYDEEYSEQDYEQMLSMYEGTMSQIAEGEIVKSKVLRVTENAVNIKEIVQDATGDWVERMSKLELQESKETTK